MTLSFIITTTSRVNFGQSWLKIECFITTCPKWSLHPIIFYSSIIKFIITPIFFFPPIGLVSIYHSYCIFHLTLILCVRDSVSMCCVGGRRAALLDGGGGGERERKEARKGKIYRKRERSIYWNKTCRFKLDRDRLHTTFIWKQIRSHFRKNPL